VIPCPDGQAAGVRERPIALILVLLALAAVIVCGPIKWKAEARSGDQADHVFQWNKPDWAPTPVVPADNPMNNAKVALGRLLFYDKRLSIDETMSCGKLPSTIPCIYRRKPRPSRRRR